MRKLRRVIYFFLVALCIAPVLAQATDCPAIVQTAIKAVGELCKSTGMNQACYGSVSLKADPQPGVTDFVFDKPGDVARVANLKSLRVDPFDEVNQEWGVALMRLQANIPDTLPGQSVSFLVFGDVQLENRVPAAASPSITAPSDSVVLGAPQADAPIVGALSAGDKAFALSQSADGAWVRIELQSSDGRSGWIPASLFPQAADLPIFDVEAASPMQAFSLQTGVTGVKCTDAPKDGILVQTPGGGDIKIKLTVNDVNIELGSTAYLQAQPSNNLKFSVIEGLGKIESRGQSVEVPAGSWVSIPMDANLEPIGTISNPKGYEPGALDNLPIQLLARPITVAEPIISAPSNLCVSNPDGAWLRAQPNSANQTILRVMPKGATVIDSGSTTNDGTQTWRQVETSDEQFTGWVEDASLGGCGNAPKATATPAILPNCTPRADWAVIYSVQSGNTLAQIAQAAQVSLTDLAQANCIADVNKIVTGQKIRLPREIILPTATPAIGATITATPAPTIASGQWQITASLVYQGCQFTPEPTPQVATSTVDVVVSPDGNSLSITTNDSAVTLQRTGDNTYIGSVPEIDGRATLNVTVPNGANSQANVTVLAPCPQPSTGPASY